MTEAHGVGRILRSWRRSRRLSQEQLALEAEVSPRHLSCIETGRARPSRDMVLRLASVLDLPLRERNVLLGAAGFAPAYRQTDFFSAEMAPVRRAVEFMLERHEPYGAVVIDSGWNVLLANSGAQRLLAAFFPQGDPSLLGNMLRLTLDPAGLRNVLTNWAPLARMTIHRTRLEAAAQGPESPAARILEEVMALDGLPDDVHQVPDPDALPLVVPLSLRRDELGVDLFATITTVGTPADVTAQEIRVETWFPADEASERWWREFMT